ncbi:MAG TPA: putative lipid II flippase FtsW [Thermodesulfobacteriota bacterium]
MNGRLQAIWGDRQIVLPVVALVALGIVMVYSASFVLATDRFGDGAYYLRRQLLYAALGFVVMAACATMPLARLERLARPALLGGLVLLALTHVPGVAHRVAGTARWIAAGGLSFQPAEAMKVALVLWLAARLARPDARVDRWDGLLPRLAVVGLVVGLVVAQPDFGTAVLLGVVAAALLFVGGARISHLGLLALAALPVLYLLVMRVPYRRARVLAFLDPWSHATGSGWQIIQSFVAVGSGGLFGRGLGEGQQKLLFLPEPHTDFVAAVVAEELGLVGFSVMVALFALLVVRGLELARRAPTPFAALLATGAALTIGVQAIVNLGVVLGCLPTKGLPLPFVSAGGSALVAALACAGLLLNVSAAVRSGAPMRAVRAAAVPLARGTATRGATRRAPAGPVSPAARRRRP